MGLKGNQTVLGNKTFSNNVTVSGTFSANVSASDVSGTLSTGNIPDLAASKITSGTFSTSRIPSLNASKITTGELDKDRIPNLVWTDLPYGAGGDTSSLGNTTRSQYTIDGFGMVNLKGVIESDTAGQAMAILPVGFRPHSILRIPVHTSSLGIMLNFTIKIIEINTNGAIKLINADGNGNQTSVTGTVWLDSVSFLAA
ncbi:MAG: hypothetical protein RH860_11060 [Cytophagales bacterium]